MQYLMKMSYVYAYFAFYSCTNINDFLKFNDQHSMQDELMVGKIAFVMFLSQWYMHCIRILQWIA